MGIYLLYDRREVIYVGRSDSSIGKRLTELDTFESGNLIEQMVAQQLRMALGTFGRPSELYHWRREGVRAGEIDYVVEIEGHILPIEVKSGSAGSMKSLHQFMFDKKLQYALRLDRNASEETLEEQFVVEHSLPHGHVAAVLGMLSGVELTCAAISAFTLSASACAST